MGLAPGPCPCPSAAHRSHGTCSSSRPSGQQLPAASSPRHSAAPSCTRPQAGWGGRLGGRLGASASGSCCYHSVCRVRLKEQTQAPEAISSLPGAVLYGL